MQDLTPFDSYYPIALFPVKVQVRFMTVKHVTKNFSKEMVFDSSEATTTTTGIRENSLKSIRSFSRNADPTGGLLPSLSFNDQNIKKHLFPSKLLKSVADKKELWVRIYPDDIFVHTHEKKLTKEELAAGKTYWQAVYRTRHEENPITHKIEAWTKLFTAYKAHRAAWIIHRTTPIVHDYESFTYYDKEGITHDDWKEKLPDGLKELPINYQQKYDQKLKDSSWSNAPYTELFPTHFVAIALDQDGNIIKQEKGRQVPEKVILGINPGNIEENDNFEQLAEEIKMPTDLQWLTDFDAAVNLGLGIKMPLTEEEAENGFEKLLVLGVRENYDPNDNKELLIELLNNHYYKNGSLEIFRQGKPTNATGTSTQAM